MRTALPILMTKLAVAFIVTAGMAVAESFKDVRYGNKARNLLDLYVPAGVESPPLVVFVHGGRWFRNDKTQIERHDRVNALNRAGFAVASVNYTFSSEAHWPAQKDDLVEAFAFLRRRSEQFGFDAKRIAVWGQSSGAHLALWAAYQGALDPATRLQALVSWYAPSDLYALIPDRAADNVEDRGNLEKEPTPESLLIGAPVAENKAKADQASPFQYLRILPEHVPLPSTLLVHGTEDFVVSPLQTDRLYMAMKSHGGARELRLRRVKNAGHGGDAFDSEVAPVIDFLKTAFAGR